MMNVLLFVVIIIPIGVYSLQFNATEYRKVLKMSLLFYEAQRSGKLPPINRIRWRGDSALMDRGQNGEDLTGGYYDASDFVKFGFTMAFSTTLLAWGILSYPNAYEQTGEYDHALQTVKWASDYFCKCHTRPMELYGQVGNFSVDHLFWGRPEDMQLPRPAYKIDKTHPGTELAAETGAALAATSILFPGNYSRQLVAHSEDLYRFAVTYRGFYHDVIPGAKTYFPSSDFGDELAWCALWLLKATGKKKYLSDAIRFYNEFNLTTRPNEFHYNTKTAGVQLLLAEATDSALYADAIKAFCDYNIDERKRTPQRLLYVDKTGTLGHAANVAFICLRAAAIWRTRAYVAFAREQIDYMLGATGRSFVVGYGSNYPKQPHHSASSCADRPTPCGWDAYKSKAPNPQTLEGALVSGPDENDRYEDRRDEFLYNDVTLDSNAGFQGVLAALIAIDDA